MPNNKQKIAIFSLCMSSVMVMANTLVGSLLCVSALASLNDDPLTMAVSKTLIAILLMFNAIREANR